MTSTGWPKSRMLSPRCRSYWLGVLGLSLGPLFFSAPVLGAIDSGKVKLVSLLASDAVLDRYAAAVAATEPLREERDRTLRNNMNPLSYWWLKVTKGNVMDSLLGPYNPNAEAIRQACTYHVVQSGRIIKSLGLSISEFNAITRRLGRDQRLRDRVLQQAYLYRLESKINDRILISQIPEEELGGSKPPVQLEEETQSVPAVSYLKRPPHRLELFAKSLKEIEALRVEHTHQIQQEFKIDTVPDCLSKPEVFPVLNSKVQALCLKFPLQAEEIAQKNGFESEEFNQLLSRARRDPIFRWRVNRYLHRPLP